MSVSNPENNSAIRECITCGGCHEACPLFQATGLEELSPRAKALLFRKLQDAGNGLSSLSASKLAGLCLGCGRCAKICSQGISPWEEAVKIKSLHPGWKEKLWGEWIDKAPFVWPILSRVSGLIPSGMRETLPDRMRFVAALSEMNLPRLIRPIASTAVLSDNQRALFARGKALLFSGCASRYAQSSRIDKTRKLLSSLGIGVDCDPDFECCGFTLAQAGLSDAARKAAEHNHNLWLKSGKPPIITFCATCCHTLLQGFPQYRENSEWSDSIISLAALIKAPEPYTQETGVIYHQPCHAGTPDFDYQFLRQVFGDKLAWPGKSVPAGAKCCGLGGSIRLRTPSLADQVNAKCWSVLKSAPGGIVLTGCSGCVIALASTTPAGMQVGHWLDAVGV